MLSKEPLKNFSMNIFISFMSLIGKCQAEILKIEVFIHKIVILELQIYILAIAK